MTVGELIAELSCHHHDATILTDSDDGDHLNAVVSVENGPYLGAYQSVVIATIPTLITRAV